ncbi:hypothetical protein [Pseudomonas sp. A34-9]|uniref:hypothetical protein n=1 Tax=Pseudomonas sp. A34-9 TaxID=3034675 RepID=UPI00240D2971|nr:hypothetical protein [Pseudomonas sp. A34-9]
MKLRISDANTIKRMVFMVGVLNGIVAFLLFFSEIFNKQFYILTGIDTYGSGLPVALLITSGLAFSFVYLQSGGTRVSSDHSIASLSDASLTKASKMFEVLERRSREVAERFDLLDKKLGDAESARVLTDAEREKVVEGAISFASSDAMKEVFEREASRFEQGLKDNLGLERLTLSSRGSIERLKREISDLRLRSNTNLLLGMAITAGGLWLLWSTVSMVDASELLKALASEGAESNSKFLKNLILPIVPRVLLVLFVEVFAYFFLRLYRNGLSEIKYFQNELTNVESKLAAIEFAYVTKNQAALKTAIEALSRTERNFVLEKGQTTVELEKAKSDSELTRNIVRTIPKMFERNNK